MSSAFSGRRRSPKIALLIGGCLAGALAAQETAPPPPVAGTGPMRDLLARGVAAAPVTTGLAFALTITRDDNLIAGPWPLRVPGVSRRLTLSLEDASWDADALEADAWIHNETGVFVGGLRLDFLEITDGKASLKSRPIALSSPLFFGDLPPGGEASIPFRLERLDLSPDSPYTTIRGIVTGVIEAGRVEVAESLDPIALDSDGLGVTYVGDGSGQALFRIGADRKSIRKFEAGCPVTGVAVRRKSGEAYASCRDVPVLLRLSPSGKLTRTEPVGRPLGPMRYGGKGYLYGAPASIVRLDGISIAEEIKSSPQGALRVAGFDAAPDGTVWAITSEPDRKLLRIRSSADIVSLSGAGNGLGSLANPLTCRVGPGGLLYVLEGSADARPPRVSAFDPSGSLVRSWELPPGRPADLAIGADGRLEILWKRQSGGSIVVDFRAF